MYDAKTAHRWRNWDGEYCCLETDDWDWMINAGKDPGITTGDHQQYHLDRLKNLQRRVWAQKGSKAYTPEQVAADVYGARNGVAARVDRLKAIGNGQVPSVAETAFRILSGAV